MMQKKFYLFCMIFWGTLITSQDLTLRILVGSEIAPHIEAITNVCLAAYREYPYLYEGSLEEYGPIIARYAESQHGVVCAVFDGNTLVGAATGMPLNEMAEKYQQPLLDHNHDTSKIFYLGELVLFAKYRNQGYGKKMYQAVEEWAQKNTRCSTLALCAAIEDPHPLKPDNYHSSESFWIKNGLEKHPEMILVGCWRCIGEEDNSYHPMIFWTKEIKS